LNWGSKNIVKMTEKLEQIEREDKTSVRTERQESCYTCTGFGGTTDIMGFREIRCNANDRLHPDDGSDALICSSYTPKGGQR